MPRYSGRCTYNGVAFDILRPNSELMPDWPHSVANARHHFPGSDNNLIQFGGEEAGEQTFAIVVSNANKAGLEGLRGQGVYTLSRPGVPSRTVGLVSIALSGPANGTVGGAATTVWYGTATFVGQ